MTSRGRRAAWRGWTGTAGPDPGHPGRDGGGRRGQHRLAGRRDRPAGWPLRSQSASRPRPRRWLLAQHADAELDFQRRCLQLLTEAVDDGEADPGNLAYLTDRVLCADGQSAALRHPVLDRTRRHRRPTAGPADRRPATTLDERRAAVGLGPFADYERHMLDNYGQRDG